MQKVSDKATCDEKSCKDELFGGLFRLMDKIEEEKASKDKKEEKN